MIGPIESKMMTFHNRKMKQQYNGNKKGDSGPRQQNYAKRRVGKKQANE